MCYLSYKAKDMIGLYSIFTLALPLPIALYFGHNNVYKVLFLLLIGYIILIILLLANIFEVENLDMNILFKINDILFSRHAGSFSLKEPGMDDITAEEIEKTSFKFLDGRSIEFDKDEDLGMVNARHFILGHTKISP